jgi:UDP-3-O-[3-hydroxymyristoyl] glucosamine N-acyltransferase
MAGCYVGHGAVLGDECKLYPHVSIREYCRLGSRVILHDGVVVGSDGFGYSVDQQGVRTKIPQTGIVEIGDDVEIGANSTIDRARYGRTRIGRGVKIDNLVQLGHNVTVGDHAVLVAQVGIAGSSQVGDHAVLAGQAGVGGHLVIGAGAVVGGKSGVTKDVPPGAFVVGFPADLRRKFVEARANLNRLPRLLQRIARLEKGLEQLQAPSDPSDV